MNFELSTDQKLLVETVRGFAARQSPVSRLRPLRDDPLGFSREQWKSMGEMGWLALPFPEQFGGLGQSFVEVALVLEQLGTTLVPEPYLSSVVLAGMLLADVGDDAQREAWLPQLGAGDAVLAFAYAEKTSRFDPARVETRAIRDGDRYVVRGDKTFVLGGHAADAFLVTARTSGAAADADGVSLFLVSKDTPGLRVTPVKTLDGQRAAHVTFDVKLPASARLGAEGKAYPHVVRALDRAAAGACAEDVGVMSEALKMTVAYLGTREQFGVKIGTFQVLQHRAVDMFIELELARSMSLLATLRAESDDAEERARAISAAKAHIAASGRFVTAQAIQLHGGIGISDEHDIALYFKRHHTLSTLFGDEEFHVQRLARQKLPSMPTLA